MWMVRRIDKAEDMNGNVIPRVKVMTFAINKPYQVTFKRTTSISILPKTGTAIGFNVKKSFLKQRKNVCV